MKSRSSSATRAGGVEALLHGAGDLAVDRDLLGGATLALEVVDHGIQAVDACRARVHDLAGQVAQGLALRMVGCGAVGHLAVGDGLAGLLHAAEPAIGLDYQLLLRQGQQQRGEVRQGELRIGERVARRRNERFLSGRLLWCSADQGAAEEGDENLRERSHATMRDGLRRSGAETAGGTCLSLSSREAAASL